MLRGEHVLESSHPVSPSSQAAERGSERHSALTSVTQLNSGGTEVPEDSQGAKPPPPFTSLYPRISVGSDIVVVSARCL